MDPLTRVCSANWHDWSTVFTRNCLVANRERPPVNRAVSSTVTASNWLIRSRSDGLCQIFVMHANGARCLRFVRQPPTSGTALARFGRYSALLAESLAAGGLWPSVGTLGAISNEPVFVLEPICPILKYPVHASQGWLRPKGWCGQW